MVDQCRIMQPECRDEQQLHVDLFVMDGFKVRKKIYIVSLMCCNL